MYSHFEVRYMKYIPKPAAYIGACLFQTKRAGGG